ncbi:MAG: 4-(cytidine 5'-diphospho)-2-C-methyl-D-erythritol kinase [Desulfobacteraceae bacterium]|nr:4-(cytidine 5'-diphospho)-2-C-methyl-D-erythritol kinase [Desulfobacteraceae bacterium]
MMEQVLSPAKINLFLHVTARRNDGYHELYTLMTCLDFGDTVGFDINVPGVSVACDHPDVPEDGSNLVCRAANLFFDELSRTGASRGVRPGVRVVINKVIPVGAGLGGGSSNAATTLLVLNRRFGSPFSRDALMAMGLRLGADVPFFIHGGAAFARGVGEKLSDCGVLRPYHVVVFFPGFNVSTPLVYKNIDLALTKGQNSNNNALLNEHGMGKELDIKGLLQNDLEEAACRLYPDIPSVKEEMAEFFPDGLLMTGSGSSFFALFSDGSRAEQAYDTLTEKTKATDKQVFLTSFATAGNNLQAF